MQKKQIFNLRNKEKDVIELKKKEKMEKNKGRGGRTNKRMLKNKKVRK